MKKIIMLVLCLAVGVQLFAQNCYWVFFTDKKNTTFDPYQYFDPKAIDRYNLLGLDLYDISNYPVNQDYTDGVAALSEEYLGTTRWFNGVAVTAYEDKIEMIKQLPYVASVALIATEAQLCADKSSYDNKITSDTHYEYDLSQLALMQGAAFAKAGVSGKGVRIAVFDGGFPDVNTNPAFKHLRHNNRIVKTWNFATGKENVYGFNPHGRMVLSCIAGMMNDTTMLGLAPDAEFLLARTEVASERKKEEIWWVQALEWADQNGAHIVNSSLGYGDDLHSKKDMDGKSTIVTKGANKAAGKGILVCTAMGNEGDAPSWRVLVAPADADSVLSVGAVRSLEKMESYSSYGPTADGRRKPNVVACGYDLVAQSNGNYQYLQGTSFATPLVAGFAACVKQMHPEYSAMQLLEEIEKSANHYPYYDFAFGYGVPQATYFTEGPKNNPESFTLAEDENNIYVIPVNKEASHKLFYNAQNGDGSLAWFRSVSVSEHSKYIGDVGEMSDSVYLKNGPVFCIKKEALIEGQTVNMWYDGQYASYKVGKTKLPAYEKQAPNTYLSYHWDMIPGVNYNSGKRVYSNTMIMLNTSMMLPTMWSSNGNLFQGQRLSRSLSFSIEHNWKVAKVYNLGLRWGFGASWYALKDSTSLTYNNFGYKSDEWTTKKYNFKTSQFDLEFFQRFVMVKNGKGSVYLDLAVYGDWITGSRLKCKSVNGRTKNLDVERYYGWKDINKLNAGVRVRLGLSDYFAIYGQYRITDIMKKGNDLPKWEIGIQIL